jgi:acetyl-CoA acyltransferase
MAGAYDVVIAGGVESMSRVPMGSARMGQDPYGPSVAERYAPELVPQGISAELVAATWGLDRDVLDEYAVRSHRLAAEAASSGKFDRELVPITVPAEEGVVRVTSDETIRPTTTVEGLAKLRPAFVDPEYEARFPQIGWHVTAGNSSQITDGATAVLIMSAERAHQLGLRPRARFAAFWVCADDPVMMLTAPIPATEKVLARANLTIGDIDSYEVNEAFASVPLAWQRATGADPDRLNQRGGAIALGHPLGASGARLLATLINTLESTDGRYGLQTMCEAGGMANATIIERI